MLYLLPKNIYCVDCICYYYIPPLLVVNVVTLVMLLENIEIYDMQEMTGLTIAVILLV